MADLSERELGEQLIETGNKLLRPPSDIDELYNLLDNLELNLSKVEQAPSKLLQNALLPPMTALKANELLRHTVSGVKISVASCISEITRITAPDAPYNDEQMKECFQLTVTAFRKLAHVSSRNYTKAVSILDTVAKVRSSLMMLDLECDALIVEMFQLFLNGIRPNHPHTVFENMEMIMTLIIEESDEIPGELLKIFLDSWKKENQSALPLSFKLADNVVKNCSVKLRSCLKQTAESLGIDLNDYDWSALADDPSGCDEKMVSNEDAPDAVSLLKDVGAGPDCNRETGQTNDEVGAGSDCKTEMRQANDDKASADQNSIKTLGRCSENKQSEITDTKGSDSFDNLETPKTETGPETVRTKRGRKPNSLMNPEEGYDHSWVSGGKQTPEFTRRRRDKHEKVKLTDDSSSQKPVSMEAVLPTSDEKHTSSQVNLPEISHSGSKRGRRKKNGSIMQQLVADKGNSCSTPNEDKALEPQLEKYAESQVSFPEKSKSGNISFTPSDNIAVENCIKRCSRRTQQDADKNPPSVKDGTPKFPAVSVKEEAIDTVTLVTTTPRKSNKKAAVVNTTVITTSPGNAVLKEEGNGDYEQKPKLQSIKIVGPKSINEKGSSVQPIAGKKRMGRPKKGVSENSGEKDSKTPHSVDDLDERLVGSRIKIWWPKDKTFYDGVVDSFDHLKKRHKVLYADGDSEVLNLVKQRWELIADEVGVADEENDVEAPSDGGALPMPKEEEKDEPETPLKSLLKSKNSHKKRKFGSSSKSVGISTEKTAEDCAVKEKLADAGRLEPKAGCGRSGKLADLADAQASLKNKGKKRTRDVAV